MAKGGAARCRANDLRASVPGAEYERFKPKKNCDTTRKHGKQLCTAKTRQRVKTAWN
jgi:hypothetical protein